MSFLKPSLFTGAALAMTLAIPLSITPAFAESDTDAMGVEEEAGTETGAEVDAMGVEEDATTTDGETEVDAMGVEAETE